MECGAESVGCGWGGASAELVGCVECVDGVRAECSVGFDVECHVWRLKYEEWSAKCGAWSVKWGMRNVEGDVECGVEGEV